VSVNLSEYITATRRLLHDATGQYWSNSELTDYINTARNRVAQDTKCLRQLLTGVTLSNNVENYSVAALTGGARVVDIMGISIYWGNTRIKLQYKPWTQFDAEFRYWQNMQSRPIAYSRLGALQVYIGPKPDQNYTSDWDIAYMPTALVSDNSTEEIPDLFTTPVKYYAAYLAKFKEQSYGESEMFKGEYQQNVMQIARAYMTRVIPDAYAY